ncbi:MAG: aminotransferase class V-fold PLP-dependent enzyme [Actinomycetota bacterium]|nr:aminotransferase class V-fold PLP-dependent enzyme [Actinomycetota bacterium]
MTEVSRRSFLGRAGVAAGGVAVGGASIGLLAGCTDSSEPTGGGPPVPTFDPKSWTSVREQFALRTDRMHFSAWGLASPARSVRDAIAEHRQALDEDSYAALGRETELEGAAVNAAARYLRTDYGQIALTDSVEDQKPFELGCDVLVSGAHKWLFGPRGTGIIWGKPTAWARITPTIPSFDQEALGSHIRGVEPKFLTPGGANSPGGFKAFEHRWALTQAFEFMTAIGPDRVADYTHDQAEQLMTGLDTIEGVAVVTPLARELQAGLVCVQVAEGRSPFALAERLFERNSIVCGTTPHRLPYLRIGPSIVTNPDQVDLVIAAVDLL